MVKKDKNEIILGSAAKKTLKFLLSEGYLSIDRSNRAKACLTVTEKLIERFKELSIQKIEQFFLANPQQFRPDIIQAQQRKHFLEKVAKAVEADQTIGSSNPLPHQSAKAAPRARQRRPRPLDPAH